MRMRPMMVSCLLYPACLAASIAGFALLLAAGVPAHLAPYIPVVATGVIILVAERLYPAHVAWQPKSPDVRADVAFLLFIQVWWPQLLSAGCVIWLADRAGIAGQSGVWPHHWPVALQTVLMVLVVDFFRYWLHRACHRFALLWRLHEVHHSPDILYILNVGRFHPLEKALHFLLDSVPFLLLGVVPEVIAGYFLLYSVNGFFQHSNIKLKYGPLNFVVGSAETHRWHHARDPKLADCNFGNTTIIWDLVFGTWFLPADREILDIGIPDRTYPKGFLAQMVMPFRRR